MGSSSSPMSSRGWKLPKNRWRSLFRLDPGFWELRPEPAMSWGSIDDSSSDVRASSCSGFSASSRFRCSSSML